jgi:hypothetical protein
MKDSRACSDASAPTCLTTPIEAAEERGFALCRRLDPEIRNTTDDNS